MTDPTDPTDPTGTTPCAGLLPLGIAGMTATEDLPRAMTLIAPFAGRRAALSEALRDVHGMGFPAPGRSTGKAGARLIWFSQGQAMLLGPPADAGLGAWAALVDQSDAWAVVRLAGAGAGDVLARLVPLDLRPGRFKRGHTARTDLGHMMASLTRTGENTFQIMVFRSMAQTLAHDLKTAMEGVAARG